MCMYLCQFHKNGWCEKKIFAALYDGKFQLWNSLCIYYNHPSDSILWRFVKLYSDLYRGGVYVRVIVFVKCYGRFCSVGNSRLFIIMYVGQKNEKKNVGFSPKMASFHERGKKNLNIFGWQSFKLMANLFFFFPMLS